MKILPEKERLKIKKILVIGVIGIGNLLMLSGALRRLRHIFPDAHITMIVLREGFKKIYEHDPAVDETIVLDVEKTKTVWQKLSFLRSLKKLGCQLCITSFPANRLEYNILAFTSRARWRVAHKYSRKSLRSFSFLQNIRVPVDKALHDFDQNLNLLGVFGFQPDSSDRRITLKLSNGHRSEAQRYSDENNLTGSLLIGMHPGSSTERGMQLKRWGQEKFAELSRWISDTFDAKVLIFGGKEEERLGSDIAQLANGKSHQVTGLDLLTTAALIGRCALFITNDSGLMHVAVAMGVRTIAIFGPTDPGRTAPYGKDNVVIRTGIDCSPCWSIQNLGVGNVNCIHPENRCLTELSVEHVKKEIELQLKAVEHQ
jgi:heptosyltransferase-2